MNQTQHNHQNIHPYLLSIDPRELTRTGRIRSTRAWEPESRHQPIGPFRALVLALGLFLLAACNPGPSPEPAPTAAASPRPAIPPASATSRPTAPSTPTEAPPEPSATPGQAAQICSPLAGVALASLGELISNPFLPPAAPGSDNPHQGVDFALRDPGLGVALPGAPVQAALAGKVAAVIADRFPYGHAVLVETPLDSLPGSWVARLDLPTPAPTLASSPALTCPSPGPPLDWEPGARSLYLLYAHMQGPPGVESGERVACGDVLGAVGDSGNALNPHLHLEARIGPAGFKMESMAHYTPDATNEEMAGYCLWRVSGWFQLLDPMRLLDAATPESP